jgi:Na+-translocating ferredoxin:NAD+ oxidoreductase subunit G
MTPGNEKPGAPAGAERTGTPSAKLLLTLGAAGVLAGLFIVGAFQATLPAVEANRAARLEAAIFEVLPRAESFQPLHFHDDRLVGMLDSSTDSRLLERIYLGIGGDGNPAGYAIPSAEPGFMDKIGLIFGFDPENNEVLGMKVLESKETPGLGDKIEKNMSFVESFRGIAAPLQGVKPGTAHDPGDVDVITGATISSRTVIKAINSGIDRWSGPIEAWEQGGRP